MIETTKRPAEYHFQHHWDQDGRPSRTILDAVASVVGDETLTEVGPLHRYVDVDALDRLFESKCGRGYVAFEVAGCKVTFYASGDVYVVPDGAVSLPGRDDE
ncbi:MAG: HalOD1 output domain-containing protein [Halapricum sp.]